MLEERRQRARDRRQRPAPCRAIRAAAIVPAAGLGVRMGAVLPKQFLEIAGTPLLVHTLRAFLVLPEIKDVVVAVPPGHGSETEKLLRRYLSCDQMARLILTPGGATRQDSVRAGLDVLPPEIELVLVHDGARPLVSGEIIRRCLRGAMESGAAIAAVPVKDTLKQVAADGEILKSVDRTGLWQAQTPQAVRPDLLKQAFALAAQDGFVGTDEASLLEHAGIAVTVVAGGEENFKITRPGDLRMAAGLCRETAVMKIGHGFDAHRLTTNRPLILGGVTIPFELGLLGHSDADVLTHALIDAILGALGDGDIGRHFPDSDRQWQDISSLKLLGLVMERVASRGLALGNADITVICQQPKLAPFLGAMRERLAAVCAAGPAAVNIKATTTEQMGYAGRGEGIAAHAVVLLRPKPKTLIADTPCED